MFRSAMLRAGAAAAAASTVRASAAARPAAAARRTLSLLASASSRAAAPAAPRVASLVALRLYSSGGGLTREQVEGRIMSLLHGFDKVNDASRINPYAHFANDLGLDSLDTVEVVMAIEEEFSIEIPDKDADTIHSIDKAVEYILGQPDAN